MSSDDEQDGGPSNFAKAWPFPSVVKQELGADSYEIVRTRENYKTGRQKWRIVFYKGHGPNKSEIQRRDAMQLMSKRTGKPYHVCRDVPLEPPQPAMDSISALEEIYG